MKNKKRIGIVWTLIGAAFLVLLWVIVSAVVGNRWIFPSPIETLQALGRLSTTSGFYLAILGSMLSIVAGFLAGNFVGFVIGVASGLSERAYSFVKPGMSLIKATPVASFIILVLIWLGRAVTPAVTAFLIVLPVVWQNVVTGIRSADKKLLETAQVFKLSGLKKLKYIYLPAASDGYVAAVRTTMGFAWKAGVAAEVLSGTSRTLGGMIYKTKLNIETPELFAYTVVVVAISIAAEFGATAIMKAAAKKQKRALRGPKEGAANA